MSFGITPAAGFPPQASDEFPNYLQWQLDGVNLGAADIDTVDLTGDLSATRGTGENANKLTIAVASNPSAAAAAAAEELVISLVGAASGAFGGVSFSNWTGTVLRASADATWNEASNLVNLVQTGLYEVSIQGKVSPDSNTWPAAVDNFTQYGSNVGILEGAAGGLYLSQYGMTVPAIAWQATGLFAQFSDKYIVNAAALPATITPALYANAYGAEADAATFAAVVTIRRIGAAA